MYQPNKIDMRPVFMQHPYVCSLSVMQPTYVHDQTIMHPMYAF
jgi:hypothetical protein